jgi:hypothetical protein
MLLRVDAFDRNVLWLIRPHGSFLDHPTIEEPSLAFHAAAACRILHYSDLEMSQHPHDLTSGR